MVLIEEGVVTMLETFFVFCSGHATEFQLRKVTLFMCNNSYECK